MRKIQKTRESFFVYLPKKWCDSNSIKAGTEIDIKPLKSNDLLLSVKKIPPTKKKYTINYDVQKTNIENLLIGSYIAGIDEVEIVSSKILPPDLVNKVEKIVESLFEFEITEQKENSIKIEDIFETLAHKQIFERMFQLVAVLIRMASTFENKEDIIRRDTPIDRHRYTIQRIMYKALEDVAIQKELGLNVPKCIWLYEFARILERVADHVIEIVKMDKMKEVRSDMKKIEKLFMTLKKLYTKGKISDAIRMINESKGLSQKFIRQIPEKAYLEHVRRIFDYFSDIGEIVIDQEILKTSELSQFQQIRVTK